MQKVHFNNIDDLELPEVERKIQLSTSEENILYFLDGKSSTKAEIENLDSNLIESMNIIKDTIQLKEFGFANVDSIEGAIFVKLKNN